jgi:hypothetical protein
MKQQVPGVPASEPCRDTSVVPTADPRTVGSLPRRRPAPLRVVYSDSELTQVREAAELAGLTPGGFIAAAGLAFAGARVSPPTSGDRALLREALEVRVALAACTTTLHQVVANLTDHGSNPPLPLLLALNSCAHAVQHVDDVSVQLLQRVP